MQKTRREQIKVLEATEMVVVKGHKAERKSDAMYQK
jgi:hypothetical protein